LIIGISSLFLVFAGLGLGICQGPSQDITIKLQNAKLSPVNFSHASHVDKQKIKCAVCHHADPAKPKACTTCHKLEPQDKTPSAKEAFHQQCITCHKQQADKAGKVPTKCNECHKR
jgi:hypothetical protein